MCKSENRAKRVQAKRSEKEEEKDEEEEEEKKNTQNVDIFQCSSERD